jgi:sugar/nucleoside kinase (ribokinase family)
MSDKQIAIIGAILVDEILPFGRDEWTTSYGGILYNTLRLAPLLKDWGSVTPVAWIGEDHYPQVKQILSACDNVDTSMLMQCEHGSDCNILKFVTPTEREEKMTRRCPCIDKKAIEQLLACDWVHFNCLTQWEMSIENLQYLRQNLSGTLSMDLHNLAVLIDEEGHIEKTKYKDWRTWVENVDVVQMNEHECASVLDKQPENEDDFREAARRLAEAGPKEILITWGNKGSFLAYSDEGVYRWVHVPPTSHPAIDTTGCGDSFSAGYISCRLKGQTPLAASLFAGALSGWNATRSGLFEAGDASQFEAIMVQEMGPQLQQIKDGWRGELLNP